MKIGKNDIRGLIKSFTFAFKGLWFCVKNERNMRIHIMVSVCVLLFERVYKLPTDKYPTLIFAITFVIVTEMINTAIEYTVNLGTTSYNHFAKLAKDIAAGAVLIASLASIIVGCICFLHFPKLIDTLLYIVTTPYLAAISVFVLVFGILFVFRGMGIFKFNRKK